MPTHHYNRLPTVSDDIPQNSSYYTGLPSTAPPSFHSLDINLPQRNNETAAAPLPPQPEEDVEDPGISLYASSDSDLEAARGDILARLRELERRVDAQEMKLLQSPNTGKFQSGKAILERIGACFFILALVWVVMWMVKEMVVLSPKE